MLARVWRVPLWLGCLVLGLSCAGPSVRPGKPTADYLRRVNNRLILFAALFLAVLATVPTLFTLLLRVQLPFAASSMLIAVSVVLETKRQLDDLLVSRNYDSIS